MSCRATFNNRQSTTIYNFFSSLYIFYSCTAHARIKRYKSNIVESSTCDVLVILGIVAESKDSKIRIHLTQNIDLYLHH